VPLATKEERAEMLQRQADWLQGQLDAVRRSIEELEGDE
jgi:prefoldin subunit 5